MENYTVADTSAPFEFFAKNGYYTVGNKIFNHKIFALQEATRTGQTIRWHFNDNVFGKLDWKQNPNVPILELYRMRAQQLRDRYKYIICAWSGGGDSTTICESFLENGIHLDEILTLWPLSLSDGKYTPDPTDTGNLNMLSEYDFSIKPRIEHWRKQYPNQKITVADICNLEKNEYLDDTVTIVEKHSYMCIQKYRLLDQILRERIDQYGNDVCVLFGVSPVEIVLLDDYVALNFVDNLASPGPKSDYTALGTARNIEFFYWTPDMPEIVQQQAHDIYNIISADQTNRRYFNQMKIQPDRTFKLTHLPDNELKRRFRKKIIYPKFPWDWFQVTKQDRTHEAGSWETWFESNSHAEDLLVPHRSAIRNHLNLIDDRYKVFYDGKLANYTPISTQYYIIGKLPPTVDNLPL
jgi:hypothetical protein